MRHKKDSHLDRLYHYSIRKTNLGVGSVVVGLFLAGSVLNAHAVAAETGPQPETASQPDTSLVLETETTVAPASSPETSSSPVAEPAAAVEEAVTTVASPSQPVVSPVTQAEPDLTPSPVRTAESAPAAEVTKPAANLETRTSVQASPVVTEVRSVPENSRTAETPVVDNNRYVLNYKAPAAKTYEGWEHESLPVGNGGIGAKHFGLIGEEKIQFNEKTLWSGGPTETDTSYNGGNLTGKHQHLPEIRAALERGDLDTAKRLATTHLVGPNNAQYGRYLAFGEIEVDILNKAKTIDSVTDYTRGLDLTTAVTTTSYVQDGDTHRRESFISYPDDVAVTRFEKTGEHNLDLSIKLKMTDDLVNGTGRVSQYSTNKSTYKESSLTYEQDGILLSGRVKDNGLRFASYLGIDTDGVVTRHDDHLEVRGASYANLLMNAKTNFAQNPKTNYRSDVNVDTVTKAAVVAAKTKTYQQLKDAHVADYQTLFNRVSLNITSEETNRPTNELLRDYNEDRGQELEELFFQYGRYLMITSSRQKDNALPANLQGIWNAVDNPAWNSDYHLNVNLQMNYWPVYSTNMAESALPLINYVDDLRHFGRIAAKEYANIVSNEGEENGWLVHTQATPFGWTTPGWSYYWGWSPASNAWIMQNVYDYYKFTQDKTYLREKIYPMLKETAKFWNSFLHYDRDSDRYVSSPSYSPEHGTITIGNTFDQSLVWQLFHDYMEAAQDLQVDADFVAEVRQKFDKLKPLHINRAGRIKEWFEEDTSRFTGEGVENGHRHVSELVGLFPGTLFSKDHPEYLEAARNTLNHRGDGGTGWSKANKINLWARLLDGNRAHRLLAEQLRGSTLKNLWDTHAPFQIDGNFGATSGMTEMLLQSHTGYISPLPALPDAWKTGQVRGLVARGNFEVNMDWQNKNLKELSLLSRAGGPLQIDYPSIERAEILVNGQAVTGRRIQDNRIELDTQKGDRITIRNFISRVTNLQAERTGLRQATLTYDAVPDALHYVIEREDLSASDEDSRRQTFRTRQTSFTDPGLVPHANYRYTVKAQLDGFATPVSDPVTVAAAKLIMDDRDPAIRYGSLFGDWADAELHGGTEKYADRTLNPNTIDANSTATLDFIGTGIEIYGLKTNQLGQALVTIDGVDKGEIDFYNATTLKKTLIGRFDGLTEGRHTLTLQVKPTHKGRPSERTKISLDYFKVISSDPHLPEILDDRDSRVRYGSLYGDWSDPVLHGGTEKFAEVTNTSGSGENARATLTFTGTGIRVYGIKSAELGRALVTIDGQARPDLNFYKSGATEKSALIGEFTGLTDGEHTITIEVNPDTSIPRRKISLDYFEIIKSQPTPAQPADEHIPVDEGQPAETANPEEEVGVRLNVLDFGADPSGQSDSTIAVQKALAAANQIQGKKTLVFPQGQYHFYPDKAAEKELYISNTVGADQDHRLKKIGILIEYARDLTLDGGGSQFIFHGKMTTFSTLDSQNVTFKNFSVDFKVPTVVDLYVERVEGNTATYYVPEEYNYQIDGTSVIWKSDINPYTNQHYWTARNKMVYSQTHDLKTGLTWRGDNHVFDNVTSIEDLGNRRLKFTYSNRGNSIREGLSFQMRPTVRDHAGTLFLNSKDIKLENLNIHFLHGFGMVVQTSENFTMSNTHFKTPDGSLRTTAGYADFLQVSGSKGRILVENSSFENPHDDPINIHGTFMQVVERLANNKVKVRYMHNETAGFPSFFVGDEVEFATKGNMITVANSTARVVAVDGPDGRSHTKPLTDIILTFDRDIPAEIAANSHVVENISYTPSVEIRNNYFGSTPTRGILVTTRKPVVIENNVFDGMGMAAIYISNDAQGWYESGPVKNVRIRNNVFYGRQGNAPLIFVEPTNPTVSTERTVHENIKVENNHFYVTNSKVLDAKSVKNLTVSGNTIDRHLENITVNLTAAKTSLMQREPLTLTATHDGRRSDSILYHFNGNKNVLLKGNSYDGGLNLAGTFRNQTAGDIVQAEGDAIRFDGTAQPSDLAEVVGYESSDPSILSVTATGQVEARRAGTVAVRAFVQVNGKRFYSAPVSLTVTDQVDESQPEITTNPSNPASQPSADTGLAAATINGQAQNLQANELNYLGHLPADVTSLTADFRANQADATVTVYLNGAELGSGRGQVSLTNQAIIKGKNLLQVLVLAADGRQSDTYRFALNQLSPSQAALASLTIDGQPVPDFSADRRTYSLTSDRDQVTLSAQAAFAGNRVFITGPGGREEVTEKSLPLAIGSNRLIVSVQSDTGTAVTHYELVIRRSDQTNADLAAISLPAGIRLNRAFDKTITEGYTATLGQSGQALTLTADNPLATIQASINGQTYRGQGQLTLSPVIYRGDNALTIQLTAPDASSKTYQVNLVGQNFVYLSDQTYLPSSQTGWGSIQKDRNVSGNAISLNTAEGLRIFDKGVGIHANGRLDYDLTGKGYSRFEALLGIDSGRTSYGGMVFKVLVDGLERYVSPAVSAANNRAQAVSLDIRNANRLSIVIEQGENNWDDHANVADAKFFTDLAERPTAPIRQGLLVGSIVDSNLQYTQDKHSQVLTMDKTAGQLTAWKNDKVVSQLSLASQAEGLTNLRFEISDFTGDAGTISSSQVDASFIKSVQAYTGMPGWGSTTRPVPTGSRAEANEVLYQKTPINLAANSLQNIWLTIAVPKTAQAGSYRGTVTVKADQLDQDLVFTYNLEVQDATLPDAIDFKDGFDIELWQNPFAVAEYYGVEPFSERHLEILRPHMEKYRELGGHAVTTTIVDEAWAGQTYSQNEIKFPSMIKWTKGTDGNFRFDYTNFDKWVNFNKSLGIGDKIVAYSIAPWTNSVRYFDEATSTYKTAASRPGQGDYQRMWTAFLSDFMVHTERRGWKEQVYIGIDERGFDVRAFDLIDSIRGNDGKAFKTAGAMDGFVTKRDLALRIDDLNVGSIAVKEHPREFEAIRAERERRGLRTTIYTCTGHIPSNFSLSAPGESYWTMMYAYSVGGNGYLRWAYDSWVANPLEDTTHNAFEAGDSFLIFPDERTAENPVSKSSLRLEKMAEGVRDINKLLTIKKEVPALAAEVDALMATIRPNYEATQYYLTAQGKADMARDMATLKQGIAQLTQRYLEAKATGTTEVTSLTIQEGDQVRGLIGTPIQLHAQLAPANLLDTRVTWTSSNPEIATVTADGQVTGLRTGRVQITARSQADSSKTAQIVVEIARPSIDQASQVSHYDFDRLDGQSLPDLWGNRTGTVSGASLVPGKSGQALRLTGNDSISFAPTDLVHNWSVGYWTLQEGTAEGRTSILTTADGARRLNHKMTAADGRMGVTVNANPGGHLTFTPTLPNNQWTHVMWTNDRTNGLQLYINGQHVQTNAWTKTNDFGAPVEVLGGAGFVGKVDDLKIYNRALTAAEIQTAMLVNGLNLAESRMDLYLDEPRGINAELISPVADQTLRYQAADPTIVTVDDFGMVTPLAKGETTIRIWNEASGYEQTLPVRVSKRLQIQYTIPTYKLPAENLSDIEKAPGTDRQYLGQPDMIMLDDNQTLITAYPIGHGSGPIVMKISRDGGQTWEEKTDIPESWAHSYETPTLYKLQMRDGSTKLMMITGRPNWHGNTAGGWQTSISTDNGQTWSAYKSHQPTHDSGQQNWSIVAMASLVQVKDEAGNLQDKWMGVYHDYNYVNYKTYLTFDENGNEVWSKPEPYLSQFRDLEQTYQICEVGMFRSPDGNRIVALARSQSHRHKSVMFYSDDEGQTWSRPEEVQGALQGERHKIAYDPISGRLIVTFREIILDYNRNGQIENNDWKAGEWVAWVGTYEDLMAQNEGDYRIVLAEDWSNNVKSGDTGYAGLVVKPDGTILTNSYGHWDRDFSLSWTGGVTTDLAYIKLATFKLGQVDQALGRVDKAAANSLLTELAQFDTSAYTEETAAAFQAALAKAREVTASLTSQQIEINRAVASLRESLAGLVRKVVDQPAQPPVETPDPGTEVPPVDETPVVPPTTGEPTDPAPGNPTDPGTEVPPVDENPVVPPTTTEPTDPAPGNPTDPGTEVPPVDENPVVPPTTGEPTDPAPGNPTDPGTEVPPVDENPVVPPTTTEPTVPAPGNPVDPGTEVPPVDENPVVPPTTTEPTVPPTTEKPAQPAEPTAPEAPTTYVAPTLVQDTESGVRVVLGKGESTAAVGLTVTHMETDAATTPAALTKTDYDLFDIEVVDKAGNPVDITVPAVVTLPVDPGKEVDRVVYLPDGGTAQAIDFTVSDDKSAVTFEASHFSHYGIIYHQTAKGTGTTAEALPTGDVSAKIVAPVYTPDKPTYSLDQLLGAPVQAEPGLKSEPTVSTGTSRPLSTASQQTAEAPASPSYSRSARHLPNTGDQANQASLLGSLSLLAGLGLVGAKRRGKHLR